MGYNKVIKIEGRTIAKFSPVYFIADVASNHDGDLERAKNLIYLAAEAGADAAKFQHFKAKDIVSDRSFKVLGQMSHQKNWGKSVFEIYEQYEINREWNDSLAETARDAGIHFMTSPYDILAVEVTCPLVAAFKIGSGEITWIEALQAVARTGKAVFLASGASDMGDVERAVHAITSINPNFVLMQCNTNYTGNIENFRFINLNVLNTFAQRWPEMILGLSDHTPGHATVLGAVALGARVIEKHFTDDNARTGPDHGFSMTSQTWKDMVDRTRELEAAMGDGVKRIEGNEIDPAIIQRRSLHVVKDLPMGHVLSDVDLEPLRPAPADSIPPYRSSELWGKVLQTPKAKGEYLTWTDIGVNHA